MLLRTTLAALTALALAPSVASAAESYDNCTGFIDSIPATISTQGTWCLRKDLATGMTSGKAITVATNNVTIDCNHFKVGNLAAGDSTNATGISAQDRNNVTVRRCSVRGFKTGIDLYAFDHSGGNYTIEDNSVQGATQTGIQVGGNGSVVRDNALSDIGTLYAVGIATSESVDVMDNTLGDIVGEFGATAIYISTNHGGTIAGNRVRGVAAPTSGDVVGIGTDLSGRMSIRDNDIFATGGTRGLFCDSTQSRARGNIIGGFATGMQGCGDAGGNDVTP